MIVTTIFTYFIYSNATNIDLATFSKNKNTYTYKILSNNGALQRHLLDMSSESKKFESNERFYDDQLNNFEKNIIDLLFFYLTKFNTEISKNVFFNNSNFFNPLFKIIINDMYLPFYIDVLRCKKDLKYKLVERENNFIRCTNELQSKFIKQSDLLNKKCKAYESTVKPCCNSEKKQSSSAILPDTCQNDNITTEDEEVINSINHKLSYSTSYINLINIYTEKIFDLTFTLENDLIEIYYNEYKRLTKFIDDLVVKIFVELKNNNNTIIYKNNENNFEIIKRRFLEAINNFKVKSMEEFKQKKI